MAENILQEESEKSNHVQCTVTNSISEGRRLEKSDDETTSSVERLSVQLPTINENQEGFHPNTSCVRSLSLHEGKRRRRNSHPVSAQDYNLSPFLKNSLSTAGGRGLRDPMLAFDITLRKSEPYVFQKHKLDKIEEADDSAEVIAEEELLSKQQLNKEVFGNGEFRLRRSSFPTDMNYMKHYHKLLM